MNLKSFGCSFVYGTDLADDDKSQQLPQPSQLSWPALLAQQLGCNYQCYARGGVGNLYILDQILSHAASSTQDLFVICWTFQDRFDFVNREYSKYGPTWETIRPGLEHTHADFYFRNLHSEYRDKLTALTYMLTAVDVLQAQNIPFIMTTVDESPFDTQWFATPAVSMLQQRVQPHMTWFDDQNFLAWAKTNNFAINQSLHPLEKAHARACELMLPIAQRLV